MRFSHKKATIGVCLAVFSNQTPLISNLNEGRTAKATITTDLNASDCKNGDKKTGSSGQTCFCVDGAWDCPLPKA